MLLTLALGAAGGWLFAQMRLPLAWMIGAMAVTTVLAIAGVRLHVPHWLRVLMTMVLGVLLGSAFTPALMDQVQRWPLSLAALLLYVALATAACYCWFRRLYGWDRVTAYYASAPGGFNEMVMLGAAAGGDDRRVALVHSSRVLFVVFAIPLWVQFTEDVQRGGSLAGVGLDSVSGFDLAVLCACALGGYAVARLLRLPASRLLGPMLASAAVHVAGITESAPPDVAVGSAQLVIGAAIGARFSGLPWRKVLGIMAASLGATVILLLITAVAALALAPVLGFGLAPVVLAFAPGGLAEMSLIALSLGVEVAFVATHHAVRILIIVTAAPLAFGWLERRSGPG